MVEPLISADQHGAKKLYTVLRRIKFPERHPACPSHTARKPSWESPHLSVALALSRLSSHPIFLIDLIDTMSCCLFFVLAFRPHKTTLSQRQSSQNKCLHVYNLHMYNYIYIYMYRYVYIYIYMYINKLSFASQLPQSGQPWSSSKRRDQTCQRWLHILAVKHWAWTAWMMGFRPKSVKHISK